MPPRRIAPLCLLHDDRLEGALAALSRLCGHLPALIARLAEWRRRSRSRRALAALDARLLKDVGLSEAEARLEAARPFWR